MRPVGEIAEKIEAELGARSDEARRIHSQGYIPTRLEVLGVPAPRIREVVRDVYRCTKGETPQRILSLTHELVRRRVHEARQVGYEVLARRPDAMALLNTEIIEKLGRGNDNWASVDGFACFITGRAWREGCLGDADVRGWARLQDRWWRRTALVSTVPLNKKSRGGEGDVPRTLALCAVLAGDHDDMVAKALSWALRELVQHDARAVEDFLAQHDDVLAGRVRREVGNKLRTGKKNPKR